MKTLPKFAPSKSAFDSALFTPGGTFDGYLHKRPVQNGIKLTYQDENYDLNRDGVFCLQTQHNGKAWYSYGGKLNASLGMRERAELAQIIRALAVA